MESHNYSHETKINPGSSDENRCKNTIIPFCIKQKKIFCAPCLFVSIFQVIIVQNLSPCQIYILSTHLNQAIKSPERLAHLRWHLGESKNVDRSGVPRG